MARLEEISEINPRLSSVLGEGDEVSFLGMADVSELGSTSLGISRTYGEVKKGYTPFADGDLLFAKITPCFENGKIAQAQLEHPIGFGSTEFHVVRADEERANARYLLHLIRGPEVRSAGQRRMTGSGGQQRVPADFLRSIQIPLPPLTEQRRIAAILDQADELRTKRRRALELLDELVDSLFIDMFGKHDRETKRFPLREVTKLITKGTTPTSVGLDYAQTGVPFIRVQNLRHGKVDAAEDALHISEDAHQTLSRSQILRGDVLISIAGTIGRTALVESSAGPMNCNQAVAIVRPTSRVIGSFLAAWLASSDVQTQIRRTAVTATISNLSLGQLASLSVPLPDMDAQKRFRIKSEQLQAMRTDLKKVAGDSDELFASLQHRAFRGEL